MSVMNDQGYLIGAKRFDTPLKVYDDVFGGLWMYSGAYGIIGIIRAEHFEDAYSIVLDEFLTPIQSDEIVNAYGLHISQHVRANKPNVWVLLDPDNNELGEYDSYKNAETNALLWVHVNGIDLIEGYYYQDNATDSGIVSVDVGYESLREITIEELAEYGITLELELDDDDEIE